MRNNETQQFDLPDHCELDAVFIYEHDHPDEPDYIAVPLEQVPCDKKGLLQYEQPDTFDVTDDYRQAVDDRAEMHIDEIKLNHDTIHGAPV